MRVSISMTSSRFTFSWAATTINFVVRQRVTVGGSICGAGIRLKPCFIERRLKNSLRWALVVATLTMRQFSGCIRGSRP